MPRLDNILIALRPRFDVPADNISVPRCVCCRKNIISGQERFRCPCRSCEYCSSGCRSKDLSIHRSRCNKIQAMSNDIEERVFNLNPRFFLRTGVPFAQRDADQMINKRIDYFNAREKLIKELIHEGCQRRDSAGAIKNNELAFDIAVMQCRDLLLLERGTDFVLNLYLLTGRVQELYDLSCHYTRSVRDCFGQGDHELNLIWKNQVRREDITRSQFNRRSGDGSLFFDNSAPNFTAICHIFLVKYFLHMNMSNLIAIHQHFLGNQDCIELIGEYAGIKKEWIIWKDNWYRDQAFEVIRYFHCEEIYYEWGRGSAFRYFEKIKEFAAEFSCEMSQSIHTAFEVGTKGVDDVGLQQRQERSMTNSRWTEIIKSYEADHNLLYSICIRPSLPWAMKKLNAMAGWHAIGMNTDPSLCVTEFITAAIKSCPNREHFLATLFEFMNEGYDSEEDEEEYQDFQNNRCFSPTMEACLLIERKIAQCNFHKNKGCDQAKEILDQLSGRQESYTVHPPAEDPDGPFNDCLSIPWSDVGSFVSEWLPDVTNVVDAIFEAGLATDENLNVLFGRSGYASYRIWELQEKKRKCTQKSITSFVTRSRIWKEGCIDNDKKLGFKIQYLTKMDRRQRFEHIKTLIPVGNSIIYLEPSLEQFVKKFGQKNLGIEYGLFGSFDDTFECEEPIGSIPKRHRRELDGFLTIEEACRHFFDTSKIEEAIWDLVGIPRLIVLEGDREVMQKAGWKYCGNKSVLGDKSVQLGSRVAYVYSGSCTIWQEQKPRNMASSDTHMDTG